MGIEVCAFNMSIWKAEVGGLVVRFHPGNMDSQQRGKEGLKERRRESEKEGGKEEGKGKKRREKCDNKHSTSDIIYIYLSFLLKKNVINF